VSYTANHRHINSNGIEYISDAIEIGQIKGALSVQRLGTCLAAAAAAAAATVKMMRKITS